MSYSQTDFEKLSWIVDRWVSTDGDATSYEHWEKVSNDLIVGSSETIKNGDTVFHEKLKIAKEGDDIFYIAEVKHNPAPVKFKLTSISENMTFLRKLFTRIQTEIFMRQSKAPAKTENGERWISL
jgi:hypothetical protein